jgi:hypothetical protein
MFGVRIEPFQLVMCGCGYNPIDAMLPRPDKVGQGLDLDVKAIQFSDFILLRDKFNLFEYIEVNI